MNLKEMMNDAIDNVLAKDMIRQAIENDSANDYIKYTTGEYAKHIVKEVSIQTDFESAARQGKLNIIKAIMDYPEKEYIPGTYGTAKAMHGAAANGHTEAVKLISAKLEKQHFTGSLFYAASEGHTETAQTLIDMGAELNTVVNNPLEVACSCGRYDTAKMLIQNGSDVNFNDDAALKKAILSGRNNIAQSLIMEHGAKIIDREFFQQWSPDVFQWEKKRELNERLQQKYPPKPIKKTKGLTLKI